MKLYHCPKTRSARVVWLLGELGDVPCEIVTRKFRPTTGNIYAQETPSGKFPTLEDDETVIFESGAIIEYILERHGRGRLRPSPESHEFGPYLQWLHFAEATLGIPLAIFNQLHRQPQGEVRTALRAGAERRAGDSLAVLNAALTGKSWLVGDSLTAADIMCSYGVDVARAFGLDMASHAALNDWSLSISTRPAWQAAMAGDLPY